ncbi:MAG: HAD family hydrolase [Chthonomonadales bacterium]
MTSRRFPAGKPVLPAPSWAFLWDIDGTLIDTTDLIVGGLQHAYRTFLHRNVPPEAIRGIIGIPLAQQVRILGDPELYGVEAAAMEREFIRWYEAHKDQERIIPEAVAALKAGRCAGHPTAVVTSKNRAEIANTLPRLAIEPWVDVIVSAEDVPRPKPHPDPILAALKALSIPASQAIYIGDTVHDAQAARAAGVAFCAVAWGAAGKDLLLNEDPDLLCEDPSSLAEVLGLPRDAERFCADPPEPRENRAGSNR